MVFLRLKRSPTGILRRIGTIYENQGGRGPEAFKLLYTWNEKEDRFEKMTESRLVTRGQTDWARRIIGALVEQDLRMMGEVRRLVLEALSSREALPSGATHNCRRASEGI